MNKAAATIIAVAFIAIVVGLAYLVLRMSANKTSMLFVQLTDPSFAPNKTQSINMSYSSLQLNIANASGSEWIDTYATGSVNLYSLINLSKTIATLKIPLNSTVDSLRFNVTSANITVDGESHPLFLPNTQITASVTGSPGRNQSSLLIDFSPTIITIFTGNSTIFAMVPSIHGVVVPSNKTGYSPNQISQLNTSSRAAMASAGPSIGLSAASFGSDGNVTHISFTVTDNSNQAVTLRQLLIFGNLSAYVTIGSTPAKLPPSFSNVTSATLLNQSFSIIGNAINQLSSGSANLGSLSSILSHLNLSDLNTSQINGLVKGSGLSTGEIETIASGYLQNGTIPGVGSLNQLNTSSQTSLIRGLIGNMTNSSYTASLSGDNLSQLEAVLKNKIATGNLTDVNITGIINLITNAQANVRLAYARNVTAQQKRFGMMVLLIESNGTVEVPSSTASLAPSAYGYFLTPGRAVTLNYDGEISLDSGRVVVTLANGKNYKLEVTGDNGAAAQANVTAR